jgi:hypothetical protein
MIKYNLICKCGQSFESWFSSSLEFDKLAEKKHIRCIYCDSSSVKKMLMTPNLSKKSNKVVINNKFQKNIKKQIHNLKKYVEKNCKNVGDNFTNEARNIHYNNKRSKGIYGKATPEETAELQEEGIEVATIPWSDKSEN